MENPADLNRALRAVSGPSAGADLWTRLAHLDEFCEIEVESLWKPGAPAWRVTIRPRNSPQAPAFTVVKERAIEAIKQALQGAEDRGWGAPEAAPSPRGHRDQDGARPLSYRLIQPANLEPRPPGAGGRVEETFLILRPSDLSKPDSR